MDQLTLLAEALRRILTPAVSVPGAPEHVVAINDGYSAKNLEYHLPTPTRVRAKTNLTSVPDFVNYVNRFKSADSILFVTPTLESLSKNGNIVTAILDFHKQGPEGTPQWGDHRVYMSARPSQAYQKLIDIDKQFLDQQEFAKKVEELAKFCNSHAAADIVEIARTLQLFSKGEFRSFDDDVSGSTDLAYSVQVTGKAGTQERHLTVPNEISFYVPLIDGMDAQLVPVKFKYRVPEEAGGKVRMGIEIIDRVWLEKAAVEAVAQKVSVETDLLALVGTFEAGTPHNPGTF